MKKLAALACATALTLSLLGLPLRSFAQDTGTQEAPKTEKKTKEATAKTKKAKSAAAKKAKKAKAHQDTSKMQETAPKQ